MIVHATVLLAGLACLYFAYGQYLKTRQFLSSGILTKATVIELIGNQGEDGDLFKPKFQFKDNQHNPVEFMGSVSSKPPAWELGEQTTVIYQPGRSDDARVVSYWDLFRWTIILTAIASPFLVIGLGYFVFHWYAGKLNPGM